MLTQTHLLSSQDSVNPYLSAMGANLPQYLELCAEIREGARRWTDATEDRSEGEVAGKIADSVADPAERSTAALNPYDDPD